jgi:hypothetical protein
MSSSLWAQRRINKWMGAPALSLDGFPETRRPHATLSDFLGTLREIRA